ncbi:hypothetical protein J7382_16125 [Shimia sp. R11_0]|uniref:hypothetical protein n=1 Tax=Shimia sp. R11_0 TaxID=2821096 RepID=UPI001ADA7703|nr:hypothetical protein [Shimia sp. R11_0]MBO9479076.1 hypothetical protein [Shimia sp. R11_0]
MKIPALGLSTCAIILAGCMGSSGFVTSTGVRVNPVNEDIFEVVVRPGAIEADFWCGAGDYAHRALGAEGNARVYAVSGTGPSVTSDGPDAAQFSLKPLRASTGATGSIWSWGPRVGDSRSVSDARSQCNRSRNDFWS